MIAPYLKDGLSGNISVNKRLVSIVFNNGDQVNLSRSGLDKNIIQKAYVQYLKSKNFLILCPNCNGNMIAEFDSTGKKAFAFECSRCQHSISIPKK